MPNKLLKPGAKEKHQLNSGGPSNRQETRVPTKMNSWLISPFGLIHHLDSSACRNASLYLFFDAGLV